MRKILWLLLICISMPLMGQVSELNKHYLKGQEFFMQKKYDEAINSFIYCNSIKNDPVFAFWLAYTYANKQDYLKCKKYYEIAATNINHLKLVYKQNLPAIKAWLDSNNEPFAKEIELSGFINGSWIDETNKDSIN